MNQTVRPAQLETGTPVETLAGTVERVTFHNLDNGFCVLKVHARGKRDLVTVVGHAPTIGAGEWITASGAWASDRVHGLQFKANVLKATPRPGLKGSRNTSPLVRCAASVQPWPSASSPHSARARS